MDQFFFWKWKTTSLFFLRGSKRTQGRGCFLFKKAVSRFAESWIAIQPLPRNNLLFIQSSNSIHGTWHSKILEHLLNLGTCLISFLGKTQVCSHAAFIWNSLLSKCVSFSVILWRPKVILDSKCSIYCKLLIDNRINIILS